MYKLSFLLHSLLDNGARMTLKRRSVFSLIFIVNCKIFGILEKWSLMRGGRLREVVAKGGSTVLVTGYLLGCPSRKNLFVRCLKCNNHKLYISTKVMKCTIR